MKIRLSWIILLCCLGVQADTPQRQLQEANEAYQQKNYTLAIDRYESLVQEGVQSKELYYNLGNAYYRNQRLGKAILYYERALKLAPNDADIQHNLQIAAYERKDDFGEIPPFFLSRAWDWASQLFSSMIWSVLTILLVWLGVGGFIRWMIAQERPQRKQGFLIGVLALTGSLLPFFLAKTAARLELNSGQAIITTATTTIHTNANKSSAVLYRLHEGTKVKLLDNIGDWDKVRLSNGEQGWVPTEALEQI